MQRVLRPVLMAAKLLGLMSPSLTTDANGLLFRITYSSLPELVQMFLLLTLSYEFCGMGLHFVMNKMSLLRFWISFAIARISETWTIRMINGIVEMDKKLGSPAPLPPLTPANGRRCWSRDKHQRVILGVMLVYYVVFRAGLAFAWQLSNDSVVLFVGNLLFVPPCAMDIVIIVLSYLYLDTVGHGFQTLVDRCKLFLSIDSETPLSASIGLSGDLMCFEKARQLEKIRLFHAELSDLLQLFSLCYGPLLLNLFMFSFVDMLFFFFFVICMEYPPGPTTAQDFLRKLLSLLVNVHAVIFITTVLAVGSRVNEKRKKIKLHLRLIRLSKMSIYLKRQVKMFMCEISDYEENKITAFGLFKIDLKSFIPILILLMTGIATLIQMKEHPLIQEFVNSTETFIKNATISQ